MAIWNENYDKGIENEILSIRENILNWYPFEKCETAVEIGVECDAITGMLCRKLAKVVAVDINVGNYTEIELEEQFDYVILNGIFAYAMGMIEDEKPYHTFLRQISKFLKPNGKVLLTIDNKLGLKYFNGAKESHTGNYFLGLNNYRGNEKVRTFSKTELAEILKEAGFEYQKFYYPYPDFAFPNEIFTDESISTNQYGRPVTNIEMDRYHLFDEYVVSNTLIKENIRDRFANSFLVEASRVAFESEIIYAKLNADRKDEFKIGTSIFVKNHEKKVIKYAIHPAAQEHITKICDTTKMNGKKVKYLPAQLQKSGIEFEFLQTKNLDAILNEYILKRDMDYRLPRVVSQLLEKVRIQRKQYRMIGTSSELERIYYRDIIYIYKIKASKYVCFVTTKGEFKERIAIEKLYQELKSKEFVLVERSYIVNMKHICKISGDTIYLEQDKQVQISKIRIPEVKRAINEYWREL